MKNKKAIFISILGIVVFFFGGYYIGQSHVSAFSYTDYDKIVQKYADGLRPEGYTCLNDPAPTYQIKAFPSNIKLESRKTDTVNDDQSKPSKYEYYYLSKDEAVLVKVTVTYAQMEQKGIISDLVTSPVDDSSMQEKYTNISRPFVEEMLLSRGNYLVSIQYLLTDPAKMQKSDKDKRLFLSKTVIDFYPKLENFILKNNL